ncbi:hypothetical protein GJ744_000884 [Endocarpon pusillum]|uniref:GST C-terminal domain-containing protein n=1 Tax=Endocarpon pusillum TaxID=364733 RepID=A0A8H7E8Z2_9EURO|nr:hypothetical protein GJ744_000884 [Endocarpon pusillum]
MAVCAPLWNSASGRGMRDEDKQSEPWTARQTRKVDGGFRQLTDWVAQSNGHFLVGNSIPLADQAICSALGFMSVHFPDHPWKTK